MNNYNQKGRPYDNHRSDSGDRNNRSFSKSNFRDRDSSDRPMSFKVVCDECGKNCTVPFKPSGNKPVYCSECFEKHDDRGSRPSYDNRSDDRSFSRPSYRDTPRSSSNSDSNNGVEKQLKDLNAKLDKIIESLNKA